MVASFERAKNRRIGRFGSFRCSFPLSETARTLLAGFANGKWDDLNLFRKCISGREVVVARNEHPPDDKHGIARRRNLSHSLRYRSLPTRTRDEVIARLGAGGPRADIGEVDVKWIGELHAVIAAGEVRHLQDSWPF